MHVYFSGIGGVGIGPLAMLALDAGYQVGGSDLHQSDMTKTLLERGASAQIGQDGSQITSANQASKIDWFVYSSALPSDHPELAFAREHSIKASKRGEFINQILRDKNLKMIAVAGTHGKTTTTGMLIWLFKQLGTPVSYSIGTTISFGPAAQYQQGSEYFIYEADEFDRNFLDFKPAISLITALDYDHPDTYPNVEDYKQAFRDFASQSEQLYTWPSVQQYLDLPEKDNVHILESDNLDSQITLPGHNKNNAQLAINCLSDNLKIPREDLIKIINDFPGTSRRFEKLVRNLYSDYAHHPAEIKSTIAMALEKNPNVIIVYQPHQNIRQHEIMKEGGYGDCFAKAKKVYWLPTYMSREYQKLETLTQQQLIDTLSSPSQAEPVKMNDELWQKITNHTQNDDLVLAMSAGSLDEWLRKQAKTAR